MTIKVLAVIQARTNSSRLPGKVLVSIKGKTVIQHVYDRVSSAKLIDKTFVATTILDGDQELVKICMNNNINIFRGSSEDVLERYFQLSKLINPTHVVRITADCPVIDPVVIDDVVKIHLEGDYDYTSNTLDKPFPDGQDVEIFKFSALKKAFQNATMSSEREHVTPYIKFNEKLFKIKKILSEKDYQKYRWTLDEKEDLKIIKIFFDKLHHKKPFFGMYDILELYKNNQDLMKINNMHSREEGYKKSLLNDTKVNLNYE